MVDGEATAEDARQLLLTGHEDGSVRFWDVSGVAMTPLYKYTSAQLFRSVQYQVFGPGASERDLELKEVFLHTNTP